MKIADSTVRMSAQHQKTETRAVRESLEVRFGGGGPPPAEASRTGPPAATSVSLSSQAQAARLHSGEVALERDEEEGPLDAKATFEINLLKLLVEHLTGRRIRVLDPAHLHGESDAAEGRGGSADRAVATQGDGFGLRYEYHEIRRESEKTAFQAEGVARTADGREISFNVDISLSREVSEELHLVVQSGAALKDPLVLNFDGESASLGERNFSFDLDADGHQDQVAFVGPGSGFLALDRNADGRVNDGRELFGPASGDGFAELAAFDADGNDWIDENDPVFDSLRIWSRDGDGTEHLVGLGARGVGAIYLGRVSTPLELNDGQGEQVGQLRSSGIFLEENGQVGTVQQVDLVV